jgi:hypothetical protein
METLNLSVFLILRISRDDIQGFYAFSSQDLQLKVAYYIDNIKQTTMKPY